MEDVSEEILDNNINKEVDSSYDDLGPYDKGYELKRITFKGLVGFVLSVLNFEKGILFSIKELIIRPRIVIEEYLKKDRKKLINPIRFLVFSTALSAFLNITLINSNPQFNALQAGGFEDAYDVGYEFGKGEKQPIIKDSLLLDTLLVDSIDILPIQIDSAELSKKEINKKKMEDFGIMLQNLTKENSDKFVFILVLFFSFFTFLFFRKNGYNLTENLVINAFMSSITNVIMIIFLIPALITDQLIFVIIASIISFVFTLYYWVSVYNRKTVGGFFRSLLVYLTSYFSFMILILIATIIYIVIIMTS